MISDFLDSALVIDDLKQEADPLVATLMDNEIFAKHYTPDDLHALGQPVKCRKIVFMDLRLQPGVKEIATQAGIIRDILENRIATSAQCYGLVIWSKHQNEVSEVVKRIELDKEKYTLPLFIIGLDKMKYQEANNYSELMSDMEDSLNNNIASNFFMYWSNLVDSGRNLSISALYGLANASYESLEKNLVYILFKIAKNYTGLPNKKGGNRYNYENDAVKALADLLHYDIVNDQDNQIRLFDPLPNHDFVGDASKLYNDLNAKIFIDGNHNYINAAIPGNVYEILEADNSFILNDAPAASRKIVIELTPPCDFADENKIPICRVVGGFVIDSPTLADKKNWQKAHYYKFVNSISLPGHKNPQLIRFDFRYLGIAKEADLLDAKKYRLIFRVKDKLFADILQKCSSHASRLGIPFIQ